MTAAGYINAEITSRVERRREAVVREWLRHAHAKRRLHIAKPKLLADAECAAGGRVNDGVGFNVLHYAPAKEHRIQFLVGRRALGDNF